MEESNKRKSGSTLFIGPEEPPVKSQKTATSAGKKVITKTISSAPVKYITRTIPEIPTYTTPPVIYDPLIPTTLLGEKIIPPTAPSYQDALRSIDQSLPQYVFPHNVPNKSQNSNAQATSKRYFRKAAGDVWEDSSLADWNPDDYRIFAGDLGNEVTDDILARSFANYPSFLRARVVRDKRTTKSRGFGFVSFGNPTDFSAALREVNGKYIGNRPCKLSKSSWKERADETTKPRKFYKKK